jgi:hypothetical protein
LIDFASAIRASTSNAFGVGQVTPRRASWLDKRASLREHRIAALAEIFSWISSHNARPSYERKNIGNCRFFGSIK